MMSRKELIAGLQAKVSLQTQIAVTAAVDQQWRRVWSNLEKLQHLAGHEQLVAFQQWWWEFEAAVFESPLERLIPANIGQDTACRAIEPDDFPTLAEVVELLQIVANKFVVIELPPAPVTTTSAAPPTPAVTSSSHPERPS